MYSSLLFFAVAISVIFCWDILVTETFQSFASQSVALKLAELVFYCLLAYIFKFSDRNDLIFFDHFKNILVKDRKKTRFQPCIFPYIVYHWCLGLGQEN